MLASGGDELVSCPLTLTMFYYGMGLRIVARGFFSEFVFEEPRVGDRREITEY